jgi:hypothetical protein
MKTKKKCAKIDGVARSSSVLTDRTNETQSLSHFEVSLLHGQKRRKIRNLKISANACFFVTRQIFG